MPLDGTTPWPQPNRWTIKVGLAPRLFAESRHWPQKKRLVFRRLAADAVYAAIDAIQLRHLRTRREDISRRGSWIFYLFKVERATRTIRITISEFHFHDPSPSPDPDGGGRSQVPLDHLIVHVSGSGRQFTIDRVEGILPLPPRPARNSILFMFEQIRLLRGKLRFADNTEQLKNNSIAPRIKRPNGAIHYSPLGLKTGEHINPDFSWLYQPNHVGAEPRAHWAPRLRRALKALGLSRDGEAAGYINGDARQLRRFTYSPGDGTYTVIEGNDPALARIIAQTRLQLRNHPTRPHDSQ